MYLLIKLCTSENMKEKKKLVKIFLKYIVNMKKIISQQIVHGN
jgi:hypothetical protein